MMPDLPASIHWEGNVLGFILGDREDNDSDVVINSQEEYFPNTVPGAPRTPAQWMNPLCSPVGPSFLSQRWIRLGQIHQLARGLTAQRGTRAGPSLSDRRDTFLTLRQAGETSPTPSQCSPLVPLSWDVPNSSDTSCLMIPKAIGEPLQMCTPGEDGVSLGAGSTALRELRAGGGTHRTGRSVSRTTR